ncbi:MAG: DUF4412 domain-containing protein [Candidatus Krumholzibacteriota bacterium]|nr:DUF4412 domain-containing protein [Candidatus Krumholzibacteriota bacterium]
MRNSTARVVVIAVLSLLFICGSSHADTWMKQVSHTDGFTIMGQTQPAKDETSVTWIGKDHARIDLADGSSVIVIPSKDILYFLNHAEKTYAETSMDLNKAIDKAVEDETAGDEDAKAMAEKMKGMAGAMMKFDASVTETSETKKIKDWDCRKYIITLAMPMGKSTAEAWATEDINVDPGLYWSASNAMMANYDGFAEVMKEMKKVKGIIVYQEAKSEAMGAEVRSTIEIVEISEKAAPSGTYDIPKDYKKSK